MGQGNSKNAAPNYLKAASQKISVGLYEEALIDLDKAIELDAENEDAYLESGAINFILRRDSKAILIWDKWFLFSYFKSYIPLWKRRIEELNNHPHLNRPEILHRSYPITLSIGVVLASLTDALPAVANRVKARAHNDKAHTKIAIERYDDAITELNNSIQLNSADASSFIMRAYARGQIEKHYNDAITDCDKTFELINKNIYIEYSKDFLKNLLDTDKESITDNTQTISFLDRIRMFTHRLRGSLHAKLDHNSLAEEDFKKAIAIKRSLEPESKLYEALKNGQLGAMDECLTLLKNKAPDEMPHTLDQKGHREPALLTAATFGRTETLDTLLTYFPITTIDHLGNTALHRAAETGQCAMLDALIIDNGLLTENEFREGIWPQNKDGLTPWHLAALHGQPAVLIHMQDTYLSKMQSSLPFQLLLSSTGIPKSTITDTKASTHHECPNDMHPLDVGDFKRGNRDTIPKKITTDNILHLLVRNNHVDALGILLDKYPKLAINERNSEGFTPFALAVKQGSLPLLKVFAKSHHFDQTICDNERRTALHLAVIAKHVEIVKYLVETLQMSLEPQDAQDKTPSDYCLPHSTIGIYLGNYSRKIQKPIVSIHTKPAAWENLVFQGGGVKGIAYVGALERLQEEQGLLENIRRVGGASAGAITALLVGLGYTVSQIKHMMGIEKLENCDLPDLNFKSFLDGDYGNLILSIKNKDLTALAGSTQTTTLQNLKAIDGALVGVARLFDGTVLDGVSLAKKAYDQAAKVAKHLNNELGLCPGTKLRDLFENLIRRKIKEKLDYEIPNATFKDLANITDFKEFHFVGVNPDTGEPEIFNLENTPNMVVADAVRISMSIPGIFKPHPMVTKDSDKLKSSTTLYVDGGLLLNYPIDIFNKFKYTKEFKRNKDAYEPNYPMINKTTLGLRLISPEQKALQDKPRLIPMCETNGENTPQQTQTLLQHILSLIGTLCDAGQSSHSKDDPFRTVYINTLDVGTVDFDKAEQPTVKNQLLMEGRKGVEAFLKRARSSETSVELPLTLRNLVLTQLVPTPLTQKSGQISLDLTSINKNCPELVAAFYAAWQEKATEYLHQELGVSLWARDKNGNTAFHYSASFETIEALQKLLEADPIGMSATNNTGETPLDWAKRHNRHEAIALLEKLSLRKSAKVATSSSQSTPLLANLSLLSNTATQFTPSANVLAVYNQTTELMIAQQQREGFLTTSVSKATKAVNTSNKSIASRVGLYNPQNKFASQIKEALTPSALEIGTAYDKGDCFFDSIAQGLTAAGIAIPGDEKQEGYKRLRVLCKKYADNLNNAWVKELVDQDNDVEDFSKYLEKIEYTQAEMDKKHGYSIWGRPRIEGRMLCEQLGVHLHVVELIKDAGKIAPAHLLVDSKKAKGVWENEINYHDPKVVHIAIYGSHYVPLLSPKLEPIYANKIGIKA